jgi:hypothetical protein
MAAAARRIASGGGGVTYDLTHARHDRLHCLTPGLFRSLRRGDRKRLKLDVAYQYGEGERAEFKGHEPLGADDMRVLQGLVAMAGPRGILLKPTPETTAGEQLRLFLEPRWEAIEADALVIQGSYRYLARELGYADADGGAAFRHIRSCIERLYSVTVFIQKGGRRQGFRILADYESDAADGRLYVALNPRLTRAILGETQHARIDLHEVRSLKTDAARLAHQRLCGWIDPGKGGKTHIDTLVGYVWPDEASPATIRKRRSRIRSEVIPEIERIGWTISEYATGRFEISRPGQHVLPPE